MKQAAWKVLAVVASAVLFVLALPPADFSPLGFFCFAPLFVAIRAKGFAWGFVAGMACLLLAALISWSGVFYKPSLTDAAPDWIFTGYVLFGIVVGLSSAIVGEIKHHPDWLPWILAAWAVIIESLLLVYIPAHLAITQYRAFPAMKIASFGGIWAVSYVVWALNFHLAQGYVKRRRWTMALCGAFLGIYFGLNAFAGFPQKGTLRVGIVQTESMFYDELQEFNKAASSRGAEIVVWPELSGDTIAQLGDTTALLALANEPQQAPFVTTFKGYEGALPYNTAAIFSTEGESARYKKRKLFGSEYKIHERGTEPAAARVGALTFGLNICFDSCFPAIMRDTALEDDVSIILLPTLDPVGPCGTVQAYHAAFTPFRAAELGVPIIRADTTAYSMAVDARGVIVGELGSGVEEVTVVEVTPERRSTFYKRFGDWFLWLCGLIAFFGILVGRVSAMRHKASRLSSSKP